MSALPPPSYSVPGSAPPFTVAGSAPPFTVAGSTLAQLPPPTAPPVGAPIPPPSSGRVRLWRQDRPRRFLLVAVALALIAGSLAIDRSGLVAVPVLFILVVPFEKLFPRHRQRVRRSQLGTDIGYALAGPLLSGIGLAAAAVVAVVSLAWLPGLAINPLVSMIPPVLAPIVGIALFDLAIYWTHRWYHEVPVLWRFHAIHHSPEQMDWISGFRNHPFDGTLIAPAFVFLLAAGFSAEFTGVLAVIQFVLGIFLHANVRWRLRPLHRIIITPEFHHWHHANEPGAINSNYSVFLPAWDLLFGTYFMPKQRRPQVYGVTEYIPPGMVAQLWHPLRGMGNPLRAIIHPIRATKTAFRFTRRLLVDMKRSAARPRRNAEGGPSRPAPIDPTWAPPRPRPAAMSVTGPVTEQAPYSPYFTNQPTSGPSTMTEPNPTRHWVEPTSLAEIMHWDDTTPYGWP